MSFVLQFNGEELYSKYQTTGFFYAVQLYHAIICTIWQIRFGVPKRYLQSMHCLQYVGFQSLWKMFILEWDSVLQQTYIPNDDNVYTYS